MKIIFLDFDGVLNDQRSLESYYAKYNDNDYLNPEMVARLNKIIEATNSVKNQYGVNYEVNVIITSTWRYFYTLDELVDKYLIPNGFIGNVIGITPYKITSYGRFKLDTLNNLSRADAIQNWLDNNKQYNIDSFVILDDDESCLIFKDNFVQTTFYNIPEGEDEYLKEGGLQDEHVDQAIKILNKDLIIETTAYPLSEEDKLKLSVGMSEIPNLYIKIPEKND